MTAPAFDRITIEPDKMNGQPCIRGLRLTVRRVLEALAVSGSREELKADYPDLDDEDIRQALAYASAMLADEPVEVKTARPAVEPQSRQAVLDRLAARPRKRLRESPAAVIRAHRDGR